MLIYRNIIKEPYVIISNILWNVSFSVLPKIPPNIIAMPWLSREPKATPTKITIVFTLVEKDKTNNWVLSPNSDTKTKRNATKKGYINSIKSPVT